MSAHVRYHLIVSFLLGHSVSGFAPIPLALALAVFAIPILSGSDSPAKSRIVSLNVIAVDTQGQIVEDLHREDLRVSDGGVSRNLLFLRRVGNEDWNPPPLGPNEVSNRSGSSEPYATIVLLDLFNEDFAAQANAEGRLIHDLQSLSNVDSLFLYILNADGQLVAVREIPFDLHFHLRGPSTEPRWTDGLKALMDAALDRSVGPQRPSITISDRADLTFHSLDSLAVQLSRIPGRKNIVWLNNGLPNPTRLAFANSPRFVSMRAAGYSQDLNVLSQRFNAFGEALYALNPFSSNYSLLSADAGATLDALVAETGGRFNDGKEMGDVIEQALRDARTTYQLGYEEPFHSLDGKLHKLRVATSRKGIQIQTKAHYLAVPGMADAGFVQMIHSASIPPFDAAEIGIRGVVSRDPANSRIVGLRILVNARDLALIHEKAGYEGLLRLAVVGYLESGRDSGAPIVPFELVLHHSELQHHKILNDGILLKQNVKLGARITKVRVIVIDETSETVGTLTLPV
jgi:VWFA-related protein